VCKRREHLARRATDVDGDIETDRSRFEEVEINGFAAKHANLLVL